jgi:hypothetical protein
VLAIFDQGYTNKLIEVTGRDLFPTKPYAPPCWDWVQPLGYTKQEEVRAWEAVCEDPEFWEKLPPYPETESVLTRLFDLECNGHEVYFITNRMGVAAKNQTFAFLRNHGYQEPTVLVTAKKGPSAFALDLHCYIDDKPSNCRDVIKYMGLNCKTFLMDRSWNQAPEDEIKYAPRVKSVHDFLDKVGL